MDGDQGYSSLCAAIHVTHYLVHSNVFRPLMDSADHHFSW